MKETSRLALQESLPSVREYTAQLLSFFTLDAAHGSEVSAEQIEEALRSAELAMENLEDVVHILEEMADNLV